MHSPRGANNVKLAPFFFCNHPRYFRRRTFCCWNSAFNRVTPIILLIISIWGCTNVGGGEGIKKILQRMWGATWGCDCAWGRGGLRRMTAIRGWWRPKMGIMFYTYKKRLKEITRNDLARVFICLGERDDTRLCGPPLSFRSLI